MNCEATIRVDREAALAYRAASEHFLTNDNRLSAFTDITLEVPPRTINSNKQERVFERNGPLALARS
jgi:hypothetical protein